MTVSVRDLRPEVPGDAEGFVAVRRRALPYLPITPEAVVHGVTRARPDAHARPLVAEEDGEIIGTAQVGVAHDSPEPGQGFVNVYVHPERLRRGAGSLLLRVAEEHLAAVGATKLFVWALDERPTGPSPSGAATGRAVARTSSASTSPTARCRRCPTPSPRASSCVPRPTSWTIRVRCSSWTRR